MKNVVSVGCRSYQAAEVFSLLICHMTCCRASFSDFAAKYSKEERFKGIEKMRDRESIFNDYVSEVRRREKEESRSLKEKVCLFVGPSEKVFSAYVFPRKEHSALSLLHVVLVRHCLPHKKLGSHFGSVLLP